MASKLGFRNGDLVQDINGVKVKNIQQLKEYLNTKTSNKKVFIFDIVRSQTKIKITVNQALPVVLSVKK